MKLFSITGMSCSACSMRVENAVSKIEGVTSVSVSLLTHSMSVEGSVNPQDIIQAVEAAGYHAKEHTNYLADEDALTEDRERRNLIRRLFFSVVLTGVLMYFSMGCLMWNWPMPALFVEKPLLHGFLQLILTTMVLLLNRHFFVSGLRGLWHKSPNMDTLVSMGSLAAFLYSFVVLINATIVSCDSRVTDGHYLHELYFETSAMIFTLITVGKMLESGAKGKTTDALKGLMKLAPKTATLLVDGKDVEVPVTEVKVGDVFIVRPGESIPVDGVILEGTGAVNESLLTGESIPVDKVTGDLVNAATLNQSGYLRCEARKVGADTAFAQIVQMVSDVAATKAPIAKIADRVAGIFVPVVLGIGILTIVVWLLTGATIGYALARGISVLVISCPCALGLATPVAIMVGSGVGAKNGILFKSAVSLENSGRISIVVLDKTGTITKGEPQVTDVVNEDDIDANDLLQMAASIEYRSEHPLAKAVLEYARQKQISIQEVQDFRALPGYGVCAGYNQDQLLGGSLSYVSGKIELSQKMQDRANDLAEEGKTPLLFAIGGKFLGIIAVADVVKEDASESIRQLQDMGMQVVMLTGDNRKTANAIGASVGVNHVIAGVLPAKKEKVIRKLQEAGKVVMVGDGMNDAPALGRADLGIAIGAGTDVAIDAADVVLMKSRMKDVPAAMRLGRATLRNIRENLFWAFIYNIIGIPLAAGVWIPLFGWELSPMFGAAAMSLSSFCVVSNALRLNLVKLYTPIKKKKGKCVKIEALIADLQQEEVKMEKTLRIEGMMCPHCEARVKKVLEALSQVEQAKVSHVDGTAVVILNAEVEDKLLKDVIEAQDYTVISVQ